MGRFMIRFRRMRRRTRLGSSGDTTPCKVTPVILHGVVFPEEQYEAEYQMDAFLASPPPAAPPVAE